MTIDHLERLPRPQERRLARLAQKKIDADAHCGLCALEDAASELRIPYDEKVIAARRLLVEHAGGDVRYTDRAGNVRYERQRADGGFSELLIDANLIRALRRG